MSGQKEKRTERMRETADWLNAIPVNSERQPLLDEQDGVDPGVVAHEVEAIRTGLECGADNVSCFVSDPDTREAIAYQLSNSELSRVEFPAAQVNLP